MRILSFAGHAYVWETPGQPAAKLPSQLALPWYEIAKKRGRPPVLSYAFYALDNWRRFDGTKPIQLDNIVLLQNFLGGLDEECFVSSISRSNNWLGLAWRGWYGPLTKPTQGRDDGVLLGLQALASAQTAMRDTLLRMRERCDPYVYYTRVRPYIHGWTNNPSLPDGLIYDNDEAYAQQPQQFRGETGAQSSIVPCLDVGHRKNSVQPVLVFFDTLDDFFRESPPHDETGDRDDENNDQDQGDGNVREEVKRFTQWFEEISENDGKENKDDKCGYEIQEA